jgi:molybdopterin converting factor small subunit
MDSGPKSAYEIALEKLKQRDRELGETGPAPLTEGQKEAIAEIRSKYDAQLAEREILFKSERTSALADPEALEKLEEEYGRERRRIEAERDRQIAAVRAGEKISGEKTSGRKGGGS